MEHNPELIMKRSHSECLSFPSPILSPSPIKRNSKISSSIAQEIFDFSSQADNIRLKPRANTTTNIITVKSCKFDSDSSRYLFQITFFLKLSSEWNSESNTSSFLRDCESPMGSSKNPFYQEHIFEEVSFELPSRTSNPLVRDADFKRNNQNLVGILSHTMVPCGPHTSNL